MHIKYFRSGLLKYSCKTESSTIKADIVVGLRFIQNDPKPREGRNNQTLNHQEQAELQEPNPTGSYVYRGFWLCIFVIV